MVSIGKNLESGLKDFLIRSAKWNKGEIMKQIKDQVLSIALSAHDLDRIDESYIVDSEIACDLARGGAGDDPIRDYLILTVCAIAKLWNVSDLLSP